MPDPNGESLHSDSVSTDPSVNRYVERLQSLDTELGRLFLREFSNTTRYLDTESLNLWANEAASLASGSWNSLQLARLYVEKTGSLIPRISYDALTAFLRMPTRLSQIATSEAASFLEQAELLFSHLPQSAHRGVLELIEDFSAKDKARTWQFVELLTSLKELADANDINLVLDLCQHLKKYGASSVMELLELVSNSDASFISRIRQRLPDGNSFSSLSLTSDIGLFFRKLSGQLDFEDQQSLLTLYAQALGGDQVQIRPLSDLTRRHIGWNTPEKPSTDGWIIHVPNELHWYDNEESNLLVYKVMIALQAAKLSRGSFEYQYGKNGTFLEGRQSGPDVPDPGKVLSAEPQSGMPLTDMQQFFDGFAERQLISLLFELAEEARIDACVHEEYAGLRKGLNRLKDTWLKNQRNIRTLGLRQGFVENLISGSLYGTIYPDRPLVCPGLLGPLVAHSLSLMRLLRTSAANVQDSAAAAAQLYEAVSAIPNLSPESVAGSSEGWIKLFEEDIPVFSKDSTSLRHLAPDFSEIARLHGEEQDFRYPGSVDFRGTFKPELVQTLKKLSRGSSLDKLTRQQLQQVLDKSVEIDPVDDADSMQSQTSLFNNLKQEIGRHQTETRQLTGPGEDLAPDKDVPAVRWFSYHEWNFRQSGYIPAWCRTGETCLPQQAIKQEAINDCARTLAEYRGLRQEIRKEFELMKP
ncbi:MAG: hypothetical protein OEZ23_07890, partial [Gammaproteobacteria bacterium]|nr:hypothetical protein [Gammaproteobacteria bacterium]